MKNLFKVFGVIALVAIMGFSMAACGGDDDGGGGGGGDIFPAPVLTVTPYATVKAGTEVYISWTSIERASKYKLYARARAGNIWGDWQSADTSDTSDSFSTAGYAGYTFQFKVAAYIGDREGAMSNIVTIPVTYGSDLGAPVLTASPSGTVIAGTTVNLNWTYISYAYRLYARVGVGNDWGHWQSGDTTSTSDSFSTAGYAGYTFEFKVAAYNDDGEGPVSNVVTITVISGSATPNTSLNGIWVDSDGMKIQVSGTTGVFYSLGTLSGSWLDAKNKGFIAVGGQAWRSLTSTGTLTWSGEMLGVEYYASSPNIAVGASWRSCTFTMSADGRTLQQQLPGGSNTWTRQ